MAFNKVILMGRLTAAPEMKQTPNGASVCNFSLAVDRKYSRDEEKQTDFINIVAWRQTAEFIGKYFGKGSLILVCGELQTRSWTDQQGNKRYATEVVASEVSFCGDKRDSATDLPFETENATQRKFEPSGAYIPTSYSSSPSPDFQEVVTDSDLPF